MSDFKQRRSDSLKPPPLSSFYLGFLGGLAAINAELVTFPFDNIKTRMQMNGKEGMPTYSSTIDCAKQTFKTKGIPGFYKGASAAFMRQITYSTVRMWAYEKINRYFSADVQKVGFFRKLFAGGLGGAVGCLVGNPFDIVKIRLINDILGKKYKGIIDCLTQMLQKESFLGLYKGMNVNILRAVLVNAAELAFYDKAKIYFTRDSPIPLSSSSLLTHFLSSCVSGFMAAVFSSPADVIKTRYMNQTEGAKGGILACGKKVYGNEGIKAFYKGFLPLYLRIAPWNVAFFVSYEQLKIWGGGERREF